MRMGRMALRWTRSRLIHALARWSRFSWRTCVFGRTAQSTGCANVAKMNTERKNCMMWKFCLEWRPRLTHYVGRGGFKVICATYSRHGESHEPCLIGKNCGGRGLHLSQILCIWGNDTSWLEQGETVKRITSISDQPTIRYNKFHEGFQWREIRAPFSLSFSLQDSFLLKSIGHAKRRWKLS